MLAETSLFAQKINDLLMLQQTQQPNAEKAKTKAKLFPNDLTKKHAEET
jgi:hypothetical protein